MVSMEKEKKIRIVQMLPTLSYGDAIGNYVLALRNILINEGYLTDIFAENIDSRLSESVAKKIDKFNDEKNTVVLFHLSIGSDLNEKVRKYKSRVVIIYHNLTPFKFWSMYNPKAEQLSIVGAESVRKMADVPELCIADSNYNKLDLVKNGYRCPIEVLPPIITLNYYGNKADQTLVNKYSKDGFVNILFTGRIAPNKKHEDLISVFYFYKNYINDKSRLFIVGSYNEEDLYYCKLKAYIEKLNLDDVYFTGHVKFEEILAYYHVADVFLCLSEHEGFCVPLVEAMYFGVPIIAYDCTAVGETLGYGGLLLQNKRPELVAETVNKVMEDSQLRNALIHNGKVRLNDFKSEKIKQQFLNIIKKYIEQK